MMMTNPNLVSGSHGILSSQQLIGRQSPGDDEGIADMQISLKACRYKELVHKSSYLALQNHQLMQDIENMKFEANRMLPTGRTAATPLKTIDEDTSIDGLSDDSPGNKSNRTSLMDLLNELEAKLDKSKGRLKEFSDLPSLPSSTIDSLASHPSPPPLMMASQPFDFPSIFQDFHQNLSHRPLSLTTPSITRQFTNLSSSQYLGSSSKGSFVPPPTVNVLSSSLQPFDVLTRSTMLMLDQQGAPGSWIPRAPPPTLYGNVLLWHLGRLVAVVRGLQATLLSFAMRKLSYNERAEKSGAKLREEKFEREFEEGRLGRKVDEYRRRDELRNHADNAGPLELYLAHNTYDHHSTSLLRSAFRLITELRIYINEGAAMTIGRNVGGMTTAREAKYPAGAQMIRNVINSSMQRELRSALRNLYRKARGARLRATLGFSAVPPPQAAHLRIEIDEMSDDESVEYPNSEVPLENSRAFSTDGGVDGGAGTTFLSESSPYIIDYGYTSPRTVEDTSIDMSEVSDDLGDEGGLIQPVYSRELHASQSMRIGKKIHP